MGLCFSTTSTPSIFPSWPDLPLDVAGLVHCRLASHADRVSFRAVCRDWRLAAQQRQRTQRGTMPWLNLGPGVYQSLDGEVHRLYCHGSSGCWILNHHDPADSSPGPGGWGGLLLRNPFHASAASIEIFWPRRETPKIIMCRSLSIVALLHRGVGLIAPFASIKRPSSRHPWSPLVSNHADIAFYRGKIFTLTHLEELTSHDVSTRWPETVIKSSVARGQPVHHDVRHLLVSADKKNLLMVRWSIPRGKTNGLEIHNHHTTMDLQIFQADMAKGHWSELQDLGGQSLFISKSCSRALRSTEHCHPRFPKGNRVYILGIDWYLKRTIAGIGPCNCRECRDHIDGGIPSYRVYDMMTRIVSLVSLGGGHTMGSAMSEWFFPCE